MHDLTRELQAAYNPAQRRGYSSNPGEGIEGEKLRLPGDLAVVKVRKGNPDHQKVEFLDNFLDRKGRYSRGGTAYERYISVRLPRGVKNCKI